MACSVCFSKSVLTPKLCKFCGGADLFVLMTSMNALSSAYCSALATHGPFPLVLYLSTELLRFSHVYLCFKSHLHPPLLCSGCHLNLVPGIFVHISYVSGSLSRSCLIFYSLFPHHLVMFSVPEVRKPLWYYLFGSFM